MDEHGFASVRAELDDASMATKPLLDFSANYVQRVADQLPRQAAAEPWSVSMSYLADAKRLRRGPVADPHLRFGTATVVPVDAERELAAV